MDEIRIRGARTHNLRNIDGMPAAVTRPLADQWLSAMGQAIDAQLDDPPLADAMKAALTRMAQGMIPA